MKDKINMPVAAGLALIALIAVIFAVRYAVGLSATPQVDPAVVKEHENPGKNYANTYKNPPQQGGQGSYQRGGGPAGQQGGSR